MKINDARTLSAEAQEDLRKRVVRAVVEEGMSKAEAVRTFQVSKTAIHNWVQGYETDGEAALQARKRGRPPETRLTARQAATVVRLIRDRCPDQLKLPFALWTRAAVGELLERRCGLKVSVWTVGRYLAAWGFTPQKPLRRAYERDPEAVKKWMAVEYPVIRERARQAKARIHWGDAMGLRSDHQTGTSYGPRGRTPIIPGTGNVLGVTCSRRSPIGATYRSWCSKSGLRPRCSSPFCTAGAAEPAPGPSQVLLDRGQSSGAQDARVTRWVAEPPGADRVVLSAGLQPGVEPGRVVEQRRQEQRSGPPASGHPAADDALDPRLTCTARNADRISCEITFGRKTSATPQDEKVHYKVLWVVSVYFDIIETRHFLRNRYLQFRSQQLFGHRVPTMYEATNACKLFVQIFPEPIWRSDHSHQ